MGQVIKIKADKNSKQSKESKENQKKFLKDIIVGNHHSTDKKFFTKLGKLYIEEYANALKKKSNEDRARQQLRSFLKDYDKYEADKLCIEIEEHEDEKEKMKDEHILLLFRQKDKFKTAFRKQFKNVFQHLIKYRGQSAENLLQNSDKADFDVFRKFEAHCAINNKVTELLLEYFAENKRLMNNQPESDGEGSDRDSQVDDRLGSTRVTHFLWTSFAQEQDQGEEEDDNRFKAEIYRMRAIELMENFATTGLLDVVEALDNIPDDWALEGDGYSLIMSISTMFDHLQTQQANKKLSAQFSECEKENIELDRRELESAYLFVREETECPWCNTKLGFEQIRIFPHGMAYHMRCAQPKECPITK